MSTKKKHQDRQQRAVTGLRDDTPSTMDRAIITFYVNSTFDTHGEHSVTADGKTTKVPIFSDDDMKGLAEKIANALGNPVDVLVRKQLECFRRCYTARPGTCKFTEDQGTSIIGVITTGTINQTVVHTILSYYTGANPPIRLVEEDGQATKSLGIN